MLGSAAARGALAGAVGVAAMTLTEKAEQQVTHRPDSYVPGRTLRAMTGRRVSDDARPAAANHIMHWGTGIALGALRGVWAATGLRGPRWTLAHSGVRLATDQTLENAAGTGAPPTSWTTMERRVDVLHKLVYAVVTGLVADRIVAPRPAVRGRTSH
jgi:hypothetical protein